MEVEAEASKVRELTAIIIRIVSPEGAMGQSTVEGRKSEGPATKMDVHHIRPETGAPEERTEPTERRADIVVMGQGAGTQRTTPTRGRRATTTGINPILCFYAMVPVNTRI